MEYTSSIKSFTQLSPEELYQIMKLRIEVFIIEQECFYQDADDKDQHCHHLMLWNGENLVAYARLVPAGLSFTEVSIGRVITNADVRGTGTGKILMKSAIAECKTLFGDVPIRIGAQTYAKAFYSGLGFEDTKIEFMEDGIPHLEMLYG
ncbi:GNAT family N-acetyltransferase [Pedobacter sp. G11]|uniref:GNAT family N-acetyltransferase n=1 Tax=Pedobacter sp. G11 TaxID=2482728 RepID=UPI000F5F363C|nr:GNAT family N-acetyltransferase [Pedobacter sp. G11]AZI27437.1 GNAT family N-acetyltransferase [Pedobacter sp. G11]